MTATKNNYYIVVTNKPIGTYDNNLKVDLSIRNGRKIGAHIMRMTRIKPLTDKQISAQTDW